MLIFCCIVAALSVGAAHVLGARVARSMAVKPGRVRDVMPALPPLASGQGTAQGTAGARWERAVWRAEAKVLAHLCASPQRATGVSAARLSVQLQLRPEHVEAVLARLRAALDCELSVTRGGVLVHGFDPAQLLAFRARRQRAAPARALLLVAAVAANLGAAWPVITIGALAACGLHVMHLIGLRADSLVPAKEVLWGIGGVLGGVVGMGLLFEHLLLKPRLSGPRLGPAVAPEPLPAQLLSSLGLQHPAPAAQGVEAPDASGGASGGRSFWLFSSSSSRRSSSSSRRSSSSSSGKKGKGNGLVGLIFVLLFLLIFVVALLTVAVWVRGLWRAITRAKVDLEGVSPALWIRNESRLDLLDRWIPTNDLAGHLIRALRLALTRRRPFDRDLGPRALRLAHARGGVVSALEVALAEALDPAEGLEVCAGLCQLFGGDLCVNEDGVIFCRFPQEVTAEAVAHPDQDLYAEYLTFAQGSPAVARRAAQAPGSLPVNLVGLHSDHLAAANRLAAGAWLIPISALIVFYGWAQSPFALLLSSDTVALLPQSPWALQHGGLGFALLCLSLLFAAATTAATTAARYAASASAIQGLLRDVRRAAVQEIQDGLASSTDLIDLDGQVNRVVQALNRDAITPGTQQGDTLKSYIYRNTWRDLDPNLFAREVDAVASDFDLEPCADEHGNMRYDLRKLRALLASAPPDDTAPSTRDVAAEEEVVFSTRPRAARAPQHA
jgi:hypothetical protein